MKKAISVLGIFLILLSSCSSDDNDGSNSSEIQINPPTWIQGKWLVEDSGMGDIGWRFTSNDFIIITAGSETSTRGQLETLLDSGQDVSTNNESSDTTYSITSNYPFGQTTIYSFTKVSDTEISWDTVSSSIYVKQ